MKGKIILSWGLYIVMGTTSPAARSAGGRSTQPMSDATDADGRPNVQLLDGPIDADEWTTVVLHRDGDDVWFTTSLRRRLPTTRQGARYADAITDAVPSAFADEARRYGDGEPVGVALLDTDAGEAIPVWLGDAIAFEADPDQVMFDDQAGETVAGGVAVIGRSGTLRVRGIGAVDVDPTQVVEVVERGDD